MLGTYIMVGGEGNCVSMCQGGSEGAEGGKQHVDSAWEDGAVMGE